MKTSRIVKISMLALIFVISVSSCGLNRQKFIPKYSNGYDASMPGNDQGPVHIYAARRSEKNYKKEYDDDEDIPVILAYGHDYKYDLDDAHYYNKQFGTIDKIVIYYMYTEHTKLGGSNEDDLVNSVYGNGNEKYKHLEEYSYFYITEYTPEEFFSDEFAVFIDEHVVFNFNYEVETFIPRDIIGDRDYISIGGVIYFIDNPKTGLCYSFTDRTSITISNL